MWTWFKFWPIKNIFRKLKVNESLIMACLQIYRELLSLATFLWVHSNSEEVSYLFWQNAYPRELTACKISHIYRCAFKLTIRITGRSDIVWIKSERGVCWKNFAKSIKYLLLRFKIFCYVLFYNFLLDFAVFLDWIKYFHQICLNLYAILFMA